MKNRYLKLAFISLVVAFFVSCEGDLAPETFDKLSPDNYPQNAEDVRTAVTGAYYAFHQNAWSGYTGVGWTTRIMMNTATTDEFKCFWGHWAWSGYRHFLWNSSYHIGSDGPYSSFIKGITRANNTIARIQGVEMDEALKTRYSNELKGLIAMYAYTLYDFWGPAPIVVDTEITLDPNTEYYPERPTKEWMVNFIKDQATQAMSGLPTFYPSGDWGRVNKGAAMMVLLKLYMKEKQWSEAANMASQIMAEGFELQNSYKSVFTVENEQNKEIIFAVPHNVEDNGNYWLAHVLPSIYVSPDGVQVQKWGGYKVPWEMYDKFEEDKDKRLEVLWRYVPTANGLVDIRQLDEAWAQVGAIPVKYWEDPSATGGDHGNDMIVYRYAEVLLSKAEALNQISGPNQESIDLINMVRNRAHATPIALSDFANAEALNDFILDERFRELFMEGHRREDLIRHGKYLSEAAKRGAPEYDDHFLVFPIPQGAIDENSKIVQNQGY